MKKSSCFFIFLFSFLTTSTFAFNSLSLLPVTLGAFLGCGNSELGVSLEDREKPTCDYNEDLVDITMWIEHKDLSDLCGHTQNDPNVHCEAIIKVKLYNFDHELINSYESRSKFFDTDRDNNERLYISWEEEAYLGRVKKAIVEFTLQDPVTGEYLYRNAQVKGNKLHSYYYEGDPEDCFDESVQLEAYYE